jgi:hypothetical protein
MASRENDSNRPSTGRAPDDERELYRKGIQGDDALTSPEHDDTRGGRTTAPHDQRDLDEGKPADSRASRFHTDRDPEAEQAPHHDDADDRRKDSHSRANDA